ncbi:MAG: phosphatidate cytidylyltransferase [Cyanobacteria bacterium SID2]|nr:phosphatidate cytidylyltransferase [Cyanobacteria bacterium SID2]MBP0005284.1 phosphatidate cytidylyltransferase [Cyanobacteria bacterium SBC]
MTDLGFSESTVPLWLSGGLALTWLGLVLTVAEGLYQFRHTTSEVTRKIVHIGTGNVILLAWALGIPSWVGVGASIVAASIALLSYSLPIFPGINSVGRHSLGTFFYAVSIGVLVSWFWDANQPYYAALGILVMAWGDGLAALVGQNFGRHPYRVFGMKKSVEGTLTMFLVSCLVSSLVLQASEGSWTQIAFVSIVVAGAATLLESFSQRGIDNLSVPVGSAAVAFYLQQFY